MKSLPVVSEMVLAPIASPLPFTPSVEEEDEWDMPTFAFHDLDYIPSGYSGILAPYIETGPGTMRAAAKLMGLMSSEVREEGEVEKQQIICDLGCGDGEFLISLLTYINNARLPSLPVQGLGIDYSSPLITTASSNCINANQTASWLVYDFNLNKEDLLTQLVERGVTHVFVYLVPKQLMLRTVRGILEGCVERGMCVCAHKFLPGYLDGVVVGENRRRGKGRRDVGEEGRQGMELCVWGGV